MRFKSESAGRWKWPFLLAAPVAAFVVAAKLFNTSPPSKSAQTAPDAPPELQPRTYSAPLSSVLDAARGVAKAQTTWGRVWRVSDVAVSGGAQGERLLRAEVPVTVFTDDLTVTLRANDAHSTTVNVESHSRVGGGDWGENRRHIAQFLKALDAKMR